MSLDQACKTAVSVEEELSNYFPVNISVHEGSALGALLFFIVMDVLAEGERDSSMMEWLYTTCSLWGIFRYSYRKV